MHESRPASVSAEAASPTKIVMNLQKASTKPERKRGWPDQLFFLLGTVSIASVDLIKKNWKRISKFTINCSWYIFYAFIIDKVKSKEKKSESITLSS